MFCGTSQPYHAAKNSTGSLPACLSLTFSPSLSAIHTSSGKVLLQCSDNVRYSALTAETWGYAPKCGFAHDHTNGLRVQRLTSHNVQHARYFYPGSALVPSALWCDKRTHMCTQSAQLILHAWVAGNPQIAAHTYFHRPFHTGRACSSVMWDYCGRSLMLAIMYVYTV